MALRNAQRGMTMIGWLIMLALIGFLVLIGLRLVPAYTEYATIVQTIESVHSQATPQTTPAEMRSSIDKRFNVNDVESLKGRDVAISREDGRLTLSFSYEYRTRMMGNVDAVVVFERVVSGD